MSNTTANQLPLKSERHDSPSGKFYLVVDSFPSRPGCWDITRGNLFKADGTFIVAIPHNYDKFPFCWLENHPSGNDYLICGETYSSTTMVDLNTGLYHTDNEDKFCNVTFYPSPDNQYIAVHGCYWGDSYEFKLYRFTTVNNQLVKAILPLPAHRGLWLLFEDQTATWLDNKTVKLTRTDRIFKETGSSEWVLLNEFYYNHHKTDFDTDEFFKKYNQDDDDLWTPSTLIEYTLTISPNNSIDVKLDYVLPEVKATHPKEFGNEEKANA